MQRPVARFTGCISRNPAGVFLLQAKSGLFATRGAATHGETTVHGGGLDLEDDEEENEVCSARQTL